MNILQSQVLHNIPPEPNENIIIAIKYLEYFYHIFEIFCAMWVE